MCKLETDELQTVFGSKATGTILGPQPHVLEMKGSIFDTRAEIIDKTVPGKWCLYLFYVLLLLGN